VDRAKLLVADLSKSSVYSGANFDFSFVNMSSMILSAVDYYAKVARKKEITPTAGESSSGYGLAVAKRVSNSLHGELWCDSDFGHGACFRLRLPRNPPLG
jgi:hypothetical protein